MIQPILIGTDFSPSSESAFLVAKMIAQKLHAPLHVAHTFIPQYADPNIPVYIVEEVLKNNQEVYQKQLDRFVSQAKEAGLEAHAHLIFSDVPSGLSEKAKEINAQLIVVGKTGESGLLAWMIGSNATNLLHESKTPVLMVPGGYQVEPITKLIYATQLEYDETEILQHVQQLQKGLGASLDFVKMEVDGQPNIQPDYGYEQTIALVFDQPVERRVSHDLVEDLHAFMKEKEGQILITASHYRNFITQLIEPSITKKIIKASEYPVLVYQFSESLI